MYSRSHVLYVFMTLSYWLKIVIQISPTYVLTLSFFIS